MLVPEGAQVDNYLKSPVVFEGHPTILDLFNGDPNNPRRSIGKGLKINRNAGEIVMDIQFAPEDISPQAYTLYKLYRDGYQKAGSVGFRRLEEENRDGVNHVTKWELVEFSLVPIGANQEALRKAFWDGKINTENMRSTLMELENSAKNYKSVLTQLDSLANSGDMSKENNSKNKDEAVSEGIREVIQEEVKAFGEEFTKRFDDLAESVKALADNAKTTKSDTKTDEDENADDPEVEGDEASKVWQEEFDSARKEGK